MDVFLNIQGRMAYSLDEIEDALDDAFHGLGEVTGSGTGIGGSNFDIEVTDGTVDVLQAVSIVRKALESYRLPETTHIVVGGHTFKL